MRSVEVKAGRAPTVSHFRKGNGESVEDQTTGKHTAVHALALTGLLIVAGLGLGGGNTRKLVCSRRLASVLTISGRLIFRAA